jgi:glutaredoxin 3
MTLTIYSKANCPFCEMAKKYLQSKNINYQELRIDQDADARQFLLSEGHRSVPQLYLDGKLFVQGGYDGLKELTEQQLMDRLTPLC